MKLRRGVAERLPSLRLALGANGVRAAAGLVAHRVASAAPWAGGARAVLQRRFVVAEEQRSRTALYFGSFIAMVAAPVAAGFLYFQVIAADQFISETKFAARGATEALPGADALASGGVGILAGLNANQDAYLIAEYIRSRTIVADLSKDIDLRALFDRPQADFLARFDPARPAEEFLRHWREAVVVDVDAASGVLTLLVRTFAPQDSLRLAAAIKARADAMINEMLDRMRRDVTGRGEAEVRLAMDELVARRAILERFRNARMAISPLDDARGLAQTADRLRRELIEIEVKLESARSGLEADALQTRILQSDREILSGQIARVEARITTVGGDPSTAAASLAEFDRLDVDKTIAEKRVEVVEKLLQNARHDAERRHVYLVSIEEPTLAQSSQFPRRGFMIFAIFIGAFTLWSVAAFSTAAVSDHAG